MPSFNWEDPFYMDDQLTEEEVLIRDTAREYAREHLLTRVKQATETSTSTGNHE